MGKLKDILIQFCKIKASNAYDNAIYFCLKYPTKEYGFGYTKYKFNKALAEFWTSCIEVLEGKTE